jgi:hypothetical protein
VLLLRTGVLVVTVVPLGPEVVLVRGRSVNGLRMCG